MPNNPIFSHICEAWQPEDYIIPPSTPSSPYDEFLIEIYVNFMYISSPIQENVSSLSPTMYKSFLQKREHLTKDSTSWSTISNMLSQVNVPYHVQPSMIGKISKVARSIASTSENLNLRTIPMVVSIRVVVPIDEELEFTAVDKKDVSCIEGLEKVKVEKDCPDNYQCVICLEGIKIGSEAISLPCSHFYHEDCILNWLQRSSLCPLCRFQIIPS